jgi:hypothetical protein
VLAGARRSQTNLAHGEPSVRYECSTVRHGDPADELRVR